MAAGRQILGAPRLSAVPGLLTVIFLAGTFENAFAVRDGTFRYRPFFRAVTERRVEEIRCLFIRKGSGRNPNRRFLEIELRDGTEIHPGNALEGSAIGPAIAALQAQAPRRIPVR